MYYAMLNRAATNDKEQRPYIGLKPANGSHYYEFMLWKNINHYRLFQIGTNSAMNYRVHAALNWKATAAGGKRDWGKGLVFDRLWCTVM